jgi:hypothetical protein
MILSRIDGDGRQIAFSGFRLVSPMKGHSVHVARSYADLRRGAA